VVSSIAVSTVAVSGTSVVVAAAVRNAHQSGLAVMHGLPSDRFSMSAGRTVVVVAGGSSKSYCSLL